MKGNSLKTTLILFLQLVILSFIKYTENYYNLCHHSLDKASPCYDPVFYKDYCFDFERENLPRFMKETITTTYHYLNMLELREEQVCNVEDMLHAQLYLKVLHSVFTILYIFSMFLVVVLFPKIIFKVINYMLKKAFFCMFMLLTLEGFFIIWLNQDLHIFKFIEMLSKLDVTGAQSEFNHFKVFLQKMY